MNKNAILGIMGLMSVALLGIVIMQAYWINQSIKISGEQFDKSVFAALNSVAAKLEFAEVYATTSNFIKPSFSSFSEADQRELLSEVEGQTTVSVEFSFYEDVPADSFLLLDQDVYFEQHDPENCMCIHCKEARLNTHLDAYFDQLRTAFAKQSACTKPIAQRIDFDYFDELLETELESHGVKIPYDYGVYSDRRKVFVITKTQNPKASPKLAEANTLHLFNSEYRVRLFPSDIHLPGYLMLYFPGKSGYMWRTVLPMLVGSILFSGIILFCFAYTIQVIFEQKKLSEIKTDFINNMTHEFKTPIATISLAADSMTSPMIVGNPDKIKRFAGIIKTENKRMNNHVEKVLQMALLDKKEFKLNLKEVDIHDVIDNALVAIGLQVETRGGTLSSDLQATKTALKADETHLTNAILNLLDNAIKYSPENLDINISTRNTANGIQITVADKGLGMSKDTRKRIFDKFYRIHTGNLHDIKGFGLGLSYVKAIMDAHKGSIDLKSELNKGSRFTLTFPHDPAKA